MELDEEAVCRDRQEEEAVDVEDAALLLEFLDDNKASDSSSLPWWGVTEVARRRCNPTVQGCGRSSR